jgi:hypothetical protein
MDLHGLLQEYLYFTLIDGAVGATTNEVKVFVLLVVWVLIFDLRRII